MNTRLQAKVAIVDYGLGNLYSVLRACQRAGLDSLVTSAKADVLAAEAVILPGVGAFGDAMTNLRRLDLVSPLRECAARGRPLIGICLGLQLLMSESEEFGRHQGLGIIEGPVVRFRRPHGPDGPLKVPQVGWNRVERPAGARGGDAWRDTPLAELPDGCFMYFVHSYYVQPEDPSVVLSRTRYGDVDFCSSVRRGNTLAFQFHPERSAAEGMQIYQRLAAMIHERQPKEERHAA